ncbi:MAG: hypothetical protein V3U32_08265 [Anaerolineales bacterium]
MRLSRWLQDRPYLLESAYRLADRMVRELASVLRRLGRARVEPLLAVGERITKGWLFDCRMC